MTKKLMMMLLLAVAFVARAQYTAGEWVLHPSFAGANTQDCIDIGDKVYYLVGGSLFCFDKSTLENESINKGNYLSDFIAERIFYNYDKHYLVVAYDNSNIDIIQSNGKVVNLPEIKDAIINSEKSINDVTFGRGNRMYVSTKFGYVVFDDSKFIVKESHIYNTNITSLFEFGDNLVATFANRPVFSPFNAEHETASSFKAITMSGNQRNYHKYMKLTRTGNRVFVDVQWTDTTTTTNSSGNAVTTYTDVSYCYSSSLSASGDAMSMNMSSMVNAMADNVHRSANGYIANFKSQGYYYTFDANGASPKKVTATKEFYTSAPGGDGTLWALGSEGLHRSGDQTNYYRPNGLSLSGNPFWLAFSPGQNKVYVSTSADNYLFTATESWQPFEVCSFDGQTWRNETPTGAPTGQGGSAYNLSFDPNDGNSYFYGSRSSGLVKVTNGQVKYVFTGVPGGRLRPVQAFDSKGNLWCAYPYALISGGISDNSYPLIMLPKEKVSASSISVGDWKRYNAQEIIDGGIKRAVMVMGTDDIIAYSNGGYNEKVLFIDTRGVADTGKPTIQSYSSFLDQDDKMVSWTYMRTMTADLTGKIWLSIDGIVTLDPAEAFDSNFRVNHVKVPRNDGTGLADYLLEGISVNTIAVDANNRKWIGTNGSGLYQVSEDGSQIINQFTSSNSFLPSDVIYNIVCNTNNNSVYILTANGFVEYRSKSSGGGVSMGDVHCYPNPVTPDFTGLLTITGVGDNALVKIADSAGNVIKQLKSSGGIATWDCCNADGDRVSTGVYYVIASSSGSSSNNIVAKFLVVK